VGVFKQGTPESIRSAVSDLLAKTKDYPNFVISSGCDLPPFVPEENIKAFLDAIKN